MNIKELIFDENDEDCGIQAISFVTHPAIEKDFIFFENQNFLKTKGKTIPTTNTIKLLDPVYGWKYWEVKTRNNETPIIETSHEFCKHTAIPPKNVYSVEDIRSWHSQWGTSEGWIDTSQVPSYTANFRGINESNFNLDQQLFNCRHYLSPVKDIAIARKAGYNLESHKEHKIEAFSINFAVSNPEQRVIRGVAMIPNVLIYRKDQVTKEEYYVYFSKETIKKLKQRYGFNREITIQHEENITGNAILLNSWIYPDEKTDDCGYTDLKQGSWCLEYKILNEKLWDVIKNKGVKGFSVEALLPVS